MPLPKRRTSKSKRDMRRSQQKTAAPSVTTCPQCGEAKLAHAICKNCGTYKGREVLTTED